MEHTKLEESDTEGIFFFPIKSLAYCGALRLTQNPSASNEPKWKFVPLDSVDAEDAKNLKNPPIFVSIFKNIEPSSSGKNIECHVFVVGMKKSAMKLVEGCQKGYNSCKQSVNDFQKIYGTIPAIFNLTNGVKSRSISEYRKHDDNGFFYVINSSLIDIWQLFESNTESNNKNKFQRKSNSYSDFTQIKNDIDYVDYVDHVDRVEESKFIDPYADAPNLVKVEKTTDPVTGQNIYVRWLARDTPIEQTTIIQREQTPSPIVIREKARTPSPLPPLVIREPKPRTPSPLSPVIVREERSFSPPHQRVIRERKRRSTSPLRPVIVREHELTPEPVVVEKIVQSKKPQLIIKEIHVEEPAPPPIKVVEEILTDEYDTHRNVQRKSSRRKSHYYDHYSDPAKLNDYAYFNQIYDKNSNYFRRHKSRNKHFDSLYNSENLLYKDHRFNEYDLYGAENPIKVHSKSRNHYMYAVDQPGVYNNHYHHHHNHHRHPSDHRHNHNHQNHYHKHRHQNQYYNDKHDKHYSKNKSKKNDDLYELVDAIEKKVDKSISNKNSIAKSNKSGSKDYSNERNTQRQTSDKERKSSPKKHYRKIIVIDESSGEEITKKSKPKLRAYPPPPPLLSHKNHQIPYQYMNPMPMPIHPHQIPIQTFRPKYKTPFMF